jgi:hypothetical protein
MMACFATDRLSFESRETKIHPSARATRPMKYKSFTPSIDTNETRFVKSTIISQAEPWLATTHGASLNFARLPLSLITTPNPKHIQYEIKAIAQGSNAAGRIIELSDAEIKPETTVKNDSGPTVKARTTNIHKDGRSLKSLLANGRNSFRRVPAVISRSQAWIRVRAEREKYNMTDPRITHNTAATHNIDISPLQNMTFC